MKFDITQKWGDNFKETMDYIAQIHLLLYKSSPEGVRDAFTNIQKRINDENKVENVNPGGNHKVIPFRRAGEAIDPELKTDRISTEQRIGRLESAIASQVKQGIYTNLKIRGILSKIGIGPEDVNVIIAAEGLPDIFPILQKGNVTVNTDPRSKYTLCRDRDHTVKMLLIEF